MSDRDVVGAVAAAHRAHWGTVLAATVGLTRDLDLAEDSVQEAYSQALEAWERDGVPENPAGWLPRRPVVVRSMRCGGHRPSSASCPCWCGTTPAAAATALRMIDGSRTKPRRRAR